MSVEINNELFFNTLMEKDMGCIRGFKDEDGKNYCRNPRRDNAKHCICSVVKLNNCNPIRPELGQARIKSLSSLSSG